MTILPIDIENKINKLFSSLSDRQIAKKLILDLWTMPLNVGVDQLARSILTISEGQITKIRSIIEQHFYGDPRDVIMMAEKQLGNPGHYFIQTFDEIERKNN